MDDPNGPEHLYIETGEVNGDIGYGVTVTMSEERTRVLFHDVNRLLALLDEVCPNLQDGRHADSGDQTAYGRTNAFLARMQTDLKIDPEGT